MPKKTIAALEKHITWLEHCNATLNKENEELKIQNKFYRAIDQHFHMLLSAVCSGMKEGQIGYHSTKRTDANAKSL